jgi:hypothetical protein
MMPHTKTHLFADVALGPGVAVAQGAAVRRHQDAVAGLQEVPVGVSASAQTLLEPSLVLLGYVKHTTRYNDNQPKSYMGFCEHRKPYKTTGIVHPFQSKYT